MATVKVVEAPKRPHAKTALSWRVFQEFVPTPKGKGVSCMVRSVRDGKSVSCSNELKWPLSNATLGMVQHFSGIHLEETANVKVTKAGEKEVQSGVLQGPTD